MKDLDLPQLGDLIRSIERTSRKPTQLIICIDDCTYLVGDLTRRNGLYALCMKREVMGPHGKNVENPYVNFDGTYNSFDFIQGKIEGTCGGLTLLGDKVEGFSVGRFVDEDAGRKRYAIVGSIKYPLLGIDERIHIVGIPGRDQEFFRLKYG